MTDLRTWRDGLHDLHCRDDRCAFGCDCPCHLTQIPGMPDDVVARMTAYQKIDALMGNAVIAPTPGVPWHLRNVPTGDHPEPVPVPPFPDNDHLQAIMVRQLQLQYRLGYNFLIMTDKEKIEYIRTMILALEDELHEALAETTWKPWATAPPAIHRDRYLRELTDAFHFLINLYLVVVAVPDEVYELYMKKNKRNFERQDEGYDGTGKCPSCGRAADEPGS